MQELQAIIDTVMNPAVKSSQPVPGFALATVVKTAGSSYRQSGARMLVTSTGERIGTISGGCLEQDVAEHARQVLLSGEARLVTYDTTSDDDIVWGFGLGCNGIIQILIESVDIHHPHNPIQLINQARQTQQVSSLVTMFQTAGISPVSVGEQLLLTADGKCFGEITHSPIRQAAIEDAQKALHTQKSFTVDYALSDGKIAALIEVLQPTVPLVIFGAGHDALPVAQFAKSLGWHVTVVDYRQRSATFKRFSVADKVILARRDNLQQLISLTAQTITLVMSHNFLDDLAVITHLLNSPVRYIGCLGPTSRFDRLLNELAKDDIHPTKQQLERVYAPVGLDIGADTPQAIALSILAEIQAVLAGRSSHSLRGRQGPIHASFESHTRQVDSPFSPSQDRADHSTPAEPLSSV